MRVNTFILLLLFFVCLLEANAQQWNSETDIKNHYSNEIRSLQQEIEEAKRNKEYALNLPEKEPDGRTNLKRVNMLVESNVIISAIVSGKKKFNEQMYIDFARERIFWRMYSDTTKNLVPSPEEMKYYSY